MTAQRRHDDSTGTFGVILLLCVVLLLICPDRAAAGETVWGLTPYRIRLLVACDETPRLTPELQADLCEDISARVDALLGAAWKFNAETAGNDLRRAIGADVFIGDVPPPDFESLPPEFANELAKLDKLILLGIGSSGGELRVTVRELDIRTRRWGAAVSKPVRQLAKLRDVSLQAIFEAFAPLAIIQKVEGKQVVLQPRAASLPLRDKSLSLIHADEVFQPILRYNDREGKPRRITAILWTFLTVEQTDTGELTCRLHSGLRTPLSGRRRGRIEQFALAVRVPKRPTTLVLQSSTGGGQLLGGYDVFAHPPDSKKTVHIGRTDRRGSVVVPPGEHPLRVLLVRNGNHTLARLPLVPGMKDTLTAAVPDDRGRLQAEGFINGLREELVDTVSRREVLIALTEARLAAGKLDEAKSLLAKLQGLPAAKRLSLSLANARKEISSSDPTVQARINALFDDTKKLLDQHLDDKPVESLERKLRAAAKKAVAKKAAPKKAAPTKPKR